MPQGTRSKPVQGGLSKEAKDGLEAALTELQINYGHLPKPPRWRRAVASVRSSVRYSVLFWTIAVKAAVRRKRDSKPVPKVPSRPMWRRAFTAVDDVALFWMTAVGAIVRRRRRSKPSTPSSTDARAIADPDVESASTQEGEPVETPRLRRAIAAALDLGLVWAILTALASTTTPPLGYIAGSALAIAGTAACWVAALWYLKGATPAKKWLGLRVVQLDGTPIGLRRSLIREFGAKLLVTCGLGYLPLLPSCFAACRGSRRMLHDRMGLGTKVVREAPAKNAGAISRSDEHEGATHTGQLCMAI